MLAKPYPLIIKEENGPVICCHLKCNGARNQKRQTKSTDEIPRDDFSAGTIRELSVSGDVFIATIHITSEGEYLSR